MTLLLMNNTSSSWRERDKPSSPGGNLLGHVRVVLFFLLLRRGGRAPVGRSLVVRTSAGSDSQLTWNYRLQFLTLSP